MIKARSAAVYRGIAIAVGVSALAAAMWYAAAIQLTGGLIDVAVFAPPGVALGLTTTWSAHAFAPERFTWRRGLVGALVGGFIAGPAIASLVAFAAAWNPASFHFVFNAGAWVALAGGLVVGSVAWTVREMRKRLRVRGIARRVPRRADSGINTPSRSHDDALPSNRPSGDAAEWRVFAGNHEDTSERRALVDRAPGRRLAG